MFLVSVFFLLQFPNNQTRLVPESAAEGVSTQFRLELYCVSHSPETQV